MSNFRMDKPDRFERSPLRSFLAIFTTFSLATAVYIPVLNSIKRNIENNRNHCLYEISKIADIDGQKGMSDSEWSAVYSSLGLNYRRNQGRDLSINCLKYYLESQR